MKRSQEGRVARFWRRLNGLDSPKTPTQPTRVLTHEERRAFRREQRHWIIVIVVMIALGILGPIVFLVKEAMDNSEARAKAAREATYIPPR